MKSTVIPPFLKKGDTVAIISPSGFTTEESLMAGSDVIRGWGLNPVTGKNALKRNGIFAGSDDERLSDLQWALDDKAVKAIFCSRGGHGLTRIIDRLDATLLRRSPKWLVGFSDITVLHNWFAKEAGMATIHGAMAASYGKEETDIMSVESIKAALFGGNNSCYWRGRIVGQKSIKGVITGGNLAIINALSGSEWESDTKGKILFIEETGEYLYRFDRLMQQLRLTGKLENIVGLLAGGLDVTMDGTNNWNIDPRQIIEDIMESTGIPLFFDFPAGHRILNRAVYLGVDCIITPDDEGATIEYQFPGN